MKNHFNFILILKIHSNWILISSLHLNIRLTVGTNTEGDAEFGDTVTGYMGMSGEYYYDD